MYMYIYANMHTHTPLHPYTYIFILFVSVLPECMYVYYVCLEVRKGIRFLGLEFWMVVDHHVGTGK